jgi:hypothetical protein
LYGPPISEYSGPDEFEVSLEGKLVRMGGACFWEESDSSSMTLDLSQATVKGTTFTFYNISVFDSTADEYLICWPPSATCSGAAESCFSIPLDDCSRQDGCDQDLHSLLSLTDDACEGYATDCPELNDQFSCHVQRGCTWQ